MIPDLCCHICRTNVTARVAHDNQTGQSFPMCAACMIFFGLLELDIEGWRDEALVQWKN